MKFASRHSGLAVSLILTAPLAFLAGCGSSIEDNPMFKDQQKIVARLDDDTKTIARQVEDMSLAISSLKQEIKESKNGPKADAQTVQNFDQRLKALEHGLNETTTLLSSIEGKIKNSSGSAGQMVASASSGPKKDLGHEDTAPVTSADKSKRSAQPRTVPDEASAPSKSRGSYYTVQAGDSADKIASSHKISVNDLLAANGIPQGGRILTGQRLYVPVAN